jgi:hypothetical protein
VVLETLERRRRTNDRESRAASMCVTWVLTGLPFLLFDWRSAVIGGGFIWLVVLYYGGPPILLPWRRPWRVPP